MTLIIENGSIVSEANSFVDIAFFNSYLTTRNVSSNLTDTEKEVLLLEAMLYLESLRSKFIGAKSSIEQELQWPRKDVYIDGFKYSDTSIPKEIRFAQCELALQKMNGIDLFPKPKTATNEGPVIEKKVGPLTKKYAPPSVHASLLSSTKPIEFATVSLFLNCLLKSMGGLETIRA